MKHGSLFSGIGGFDLAAEWMGWENVFHCEWNEFGQKILKYYWPKAISYADITKTDFSIHRGTIDILTGGFPCQDASNALQTGGGQKGLHGERTGLLFEMLRVIREIRPRFVVAENVENFLSVEDGKAFAIVLGELARMGFNAEWRICRASDVGAPHHRSRLYLVAYPDSIRIQGNESFFSLLLEADKQIARKIKGTDVEINCGAEWICESPVYNVVNGIPNQLAESLKAGGNAIVPKVAFQIFKAIEKILSHENHHQNT